MTQENERPEGTTPQPQTDDILTTARELEVIIPVQYAYLDRMSKLVETTINEEERIEILKEYRIAGINYRYSILIAIGILQNYHKPSDKKEFLELKSKLGREPFKDLDLAEYFRDKITRLICNINDRIDEIDHEIDIQDIE
jgi:hypothetical protein